MLAVGLPHILQNHRALAAAGWLGETEFDGGLGVVGRREPIDAGEPLHPLLGLRGLAGLGTKAVDEVLEVGDLALLVLVGGKVLLVAGFFFHEVAVVVAAVAVEALPRYLHDAVADRVEKCAVVGNDEQGAGVIRKVALEPAECFEVKVVGRFVEHEQVRFHDEQACKMRAHDPAAAHRAGRPVKIRFTKGEPGQDTFRPRLQIVAVQFHKDGCGLMMFRRVFIRKLAHFLVRGGHGR